MSATFYRSPARSKTAHGLAGTHNTPIRGIAIAAAILAGLTVIKLGIVRPVAAAWSRPFD